MVRLCITSAARIDVLPPRAADITSTLQNHNVQSRPFGFDSHADTAKPSTDDQHVDTEGLL